MKYNINEDFSFEVSAPSILFLNPNVEDKAVRLFLIIKGLTRTLGYCYATNKYLATAMNCSEPTIKRMLKSLKDEGFIEIETDKDGVHWQRKIFLAGGLKDSLRRITKDLGPNFEGSPPRSPVILNNKEVVNKIVEKGGEGATPPPAPTSSLKTYGNVQIKDSVYDRLVIDFGFEEIDIMIKKLNEYSLINPKRFKQYGCHAAVIRRWIRKDAEEAKPSKSTENNNKEIAKKVVETFRHPDIELLPHSIMFINRANGPSLYMAYNDLSFKECIISRLRKMNLPVDRLHL